mmetsp:Transcript_9110/g.30196  ORF Transcript_9110/g.30196 Transcript_9110/m.30196 type:complete len:234 (-) Transcript_9110:1645-2346(-)|eukprot:scaffold8845_cov120-Isochrysis_galbana.AAC.6
MLRHSRNDGVGVGREPCAKKTEHHLRESSRRRLGQQGGPWPASWRREQRDSRGIACGPPRAHELAGLALAGEQVGRVGLAILVLTVGRIGRVGLFGGGRRISGGASGGSYGRGRDRAAVAGHDGADLPPGAVHLDFHLLASRTRPPPLIALAGGIALEHRQPQHERIGGGGSLGGGLSEEAPHLVRRERVGHKFGQRGWGRHREGAHHTADGRIPHPARMPRGAKQGDGAGGE